MSKQAPVVESYLGALTRNYQDRDDLVTLWDRLCGMRGNVPEARKVASEMGFATAFATFHVRKLREGEIYPTGAEMLATVRARMVPRGDASPRGASTPWYLEHRKGHRSLTE